MTFEFQPGGTLKRCLAATAAALLFLAAANASAQSAWGFKAGVSQAGLTGNDAGSATTRSLPVGGIFYGTALSDNLAFQVDALYVRKGAAEFRSPADTAGMPGATLTMDYIEIPILLRAGFPTERMLFSLFLGPVVSSRIKCTTEPTDGSTDPVACKDADAIQRFAPRATDIGATAGAGIDLALGESTFFVEGRYTRGLTSIQSGEDAMDAKNEVLTVLAGFAFPLGR